jgi:hypothetical protein
MRNVILFILICYFPMPLDGHAQDQSTKPFLFEIGENGSLNAGYVLSPDGLTAEPPKDPCSYRQLLRLEQPQMCPPTTIPEDPPQVVVPQNPCAKGLCPPTVGIGGTVDPIDNRPLKNVLPDFDKLKIQTFDLKGLPQKF